MFSLVVAALAQGALGHGLVGYIQKQQGGAEICTMRVTQGNADGNYGPMTNGGDACGTPPGTPKKVLAYSGDGSDLRGSNGGSGPYWLGARETDATCRFAPGDLVTAFVYISGNHGGVAKWEYRKLSDGDGSVGDGDFQAIPGAQFDYSPTGPPETAKALGGHAESFAVPGQLPSGWHTLRWNWIAPGPVQFVHCIDVQIDGTGAPAPPAPMPAPSPLMPAPAPPAPAPAPAAGDCVSNGPAYYASACQALAATCEQQSFCRRASPEGPSPAPTPAGGECVSSGPDYYTAACQALAATCEEHSFCKRASLTQTSAMRRVRFRAAGGHVLLQQDVALEERRGHEPRGPEAAGAGYAEAARSPRAARDHPEL